MARNGSGTYSTVNTFVAGATITAATHNANWSDVASEMTNSVAVDGQSTMTGALKAASGTVALPGIAFGSDTDTGLYRIGANNLGIAANGAKVIDVATTGATVTGTLTSTGALEGLSVKQNGFALLPAGVIFPYGGSAAPSGYLLCNGNAVNRTTYAALFTAIGTTFGVGDGSTTFNLPDFGGRVPAGKEATATRLTTAASGVDGGTLGATGGTQTHALTVAQIPTLTSTVTGTATAPNSQNYVTATGTQTLSYTTGATNLNIPASSGLAASNSSAVLASGSGTTSGTGGATGGAHPIVQPTIVTNYIIFAGV